MRKKILTLFITVSSVGLFPCFTMAQQQPKHYLQLPNTTNKTYLPISPKWQPKIKNYALKTTKDSLPIMRDLMYIPSKDGQLLTRTLLYIPAIDGKPQVIQQYSKPNTNEITK